ncbi:MAG TPA: hypothetical protein VJR02_23205 [Pyrinomonadaceae bacterium]|nr:hypothetical protein [Pyrinomonadaceae bacterium]
MISYCIASYRPTYSALLVQDLIRKTTAPYEILIWLNTDDERYEKFLEEQRSNGAPVRIVGKTGENIGMQAYPLLFAESQYDLIAQIDDDVVAVSRNIAEYAAEVFLKFPSVKQLVADVWQDDYTTGARPPMSSYRPVDPEHALYDGPIDGWFSVFHRSVLPLAQARYGDIYFPLGAMLRNRLRETGRLGLLCTKFKVFHVVGPQYVSHFGMLDFEIEKYRRLGRHEIVSWYESAKDKLPPPEELSSRVKNIFANLEQR